MKRLPKYPVKGSLTSKTGIFKCFCDGLISIEQEAAGIIKTRVIEIAVKVAVKGT